MIFAALGNGLKFDDFSGLPGGTPEFRQRTSRVPKSFIPGAVEDQDPEFRQRTSRVPKSLIPGAVEDHLAGLSG